MIKIENTEVYGWEAAIRGMRNPMNSWSKSDSGPACTEEDCKNCFFPTKDCHGRDFSIGKKDLALMEKLAAAGPVHGKFMRMIMVTADITAPLYWWKEFDTYKVGTVANSCSTMHKIHAKEFTIDDFSHEHLSGDMGAAVVIDGKLLYLTAQDHLRLTCDILNRYRESYLETNDKEDWWQLIQLLPTSYNQRRTVQVSYEVLRSIHQYRQNHKLDEWRKLCMWIETLPYSQLILKHPNE